MVCYHTQVFVKGNVTGECNVLLLREYILKACVVLFGFWSSCLKVYIHLLCINTQRRTTIPFSSWSSLSQVSLLCWYYKNTVLRIVWSCLVFIQLIIKFISIYSTSSNSNKQQHHSTSLMSYNLVTTKLSDCFRGQPIVLRDIVTLIWYVCFSHLRKFTTVSNQC